MDHLNQRRFPDSATSLVMDMVNAVGHVIGLTGTPGVFRELFAR
jgi:hypothetical protein